MNNSPSPKLAGHVAAFVRSIIGRGRRFETQKALSDATGMNPSSVHAVQKAERVEPETLRRLLGCLGGEEQRKLLTAAVMDAVPEEFVGLLFKQGGGAIELDERMSPVSPLADAMLHYLATEARRDPAVVAMLEKQAMWVGLDREASAR